MAEGIIDKPISPTTTPATRPQIGRGRKLLAGFGIVLSSFSVLPACSEGSVLETKAGDTIPIVSGTIKPTEDINIRNTPSVINPVGSNMGNLTGTLNKGEEYEVKDAQIVEGYDVTLADKDDNGNLWLRVFNNEKQKYEYISMWALKDMFEVEGESEILVSRLDDQGNVFILDSNGNLTQIRGSLSPTDQ